jgi:Tol biopolymer transport system component
VDDSRPAYSPDGTKIAFISDRDGDKEIYVMDAADRDGDGNGDNLTRLTNNAVTDQDPAYSPDGTKIAFETLRDGNKEIYMMDAADRDGDGNGDSPTRLTNNAAVDANPSFFPDGTKIAFETLRDGNEEIYMMDAADRDGDGNGDNHNRLTNNAATDRYPDWGPLADVSSPRVTSTIPNATGVAPTTKVMATFSEDMMASSITTPATTFKLVRLKADGTTTKVTATVSYAAATKEAKLDPATNLSSGATYKATVTSGAQDLAGNALDQNPNIEGNQNKSWKFTVQ